MTRNSEARCWSARRCTLPALLVQWPCPALPARLFEGRHGCAHLSRRQLDGQVLHGEGAGAAGGDAAVGRCTCPLPVCARCQAALMCLGQQWRTLAPHLQRQHLLQRDSAGQAARLAHLGAGRGAGRPVDTVGTAAISRRRTGGCALARAAVLPGGAGGAWRAPPHLAPRVAAHWEGEGAQNSAVSHNTGLVRAGGGPAGRTGSV